MTVADSPHPPAGSRIWVLRQHLRRWGKMMLPLSNDVVLCIMEGRPEKGGDAPMILLPHARRVSR